MDVEAKLAIVRSFAAEVVTEDELKALLETKEHPVAYDGFEPSGLAAIHFGLQRARNIKKMMKIGTHLKLYIADYFAYLNNKLGGDIDRIRTAGKYFVEVWKAAGVDTDKVEIVWCKELMQDFSYWERFLKIGKALSLDRVTRAITIMGRKEGTSISTGQLFYPVMQATDVFQMDVDICQLGLDQRKANIIAREVAQKYKWKVPVIVSHPLLLGLKGMPPDLKTSDESVLMQYKMSKSNPHRAILMHDTFEEIQKKINSAYCPEKIVEGNPVFDYIEKILIEDKADPINIERPQKFGGTLEADSYGALVAAYRKGELHPLDLKNFVAEKLEERIKPVREHFEKNKHAKELYDAVKGFAITR